jgi:hypothetical protein
MSIRNQEEGGGVIQKGCIKEGIQKLGEGIKFGCISSTKQMPRHDPCIEQGPLRIP